jgi:hypothetical protein
MGKSVLVIGEITLRLVSGIVIAEHDYVEIRHTSTILHVLRPCNTSTCRLYKFGCNDKFLIKKKDTIMSERAYV